MQRNNTSSDRRFVQILGINVISTSIPKLLVTTRDNISHNTKFFIVTPNPELILASTKNITLREALNSADFSVPDGIGLSQAARYLTLRSPANIFIRIFVVFFQGLVVGAATFFNNDWLTQDLKPIKGRVLFTKLIELANKKGWKVFFLGGEGSEATLAAEKLRINYKKVRIRTFAGPILNEKAIPVTEVNRKLEKDAVDLINKFRPDLLFVAMKNPKQEIWIHKNLSKLNVGGAMAVGGTFRYIAGLSKLPPRWMEKAGLEWVWRLLTEPKRFRRIFNAFPLFPLRVFWFKVTGS